MLFIVGPSARMASAAAVASASAVVIIAAMT